MAPPKAAKNFEQTQPITTTLRTICQSYPPNTCLRELLQNADDAGAIEMEYCLDTNEYTQYPLLHDSLQEYMGPALLARNNAVFEDKDFESLSSVGDSGKRNDLEKCGKFGQGFSSVFHVTDGPWIFSRNWLLLLDPHHSWSKDEAKPGGPAWDVVENQDCEEIRNQLAAFKLFSYDPSQSLKETYIRLPLRTAKQAATSKIKPHAPSIDDIKQLLSKFCQEIESGGLLFLKNIRKVTVRIDQTLMLKAEIIERDKNHIQTRTGLLNDFRNMYSLKANNVESLSRTFETKIEYHSNKRSWTDTFLIQHLMVCSCGDSELDNWARDLKLFPWVAVAAPIDVHGSSFVGKLFSTLSLPILTNQPVHIHGLFAIAPDRARLGFEDSELQWNARMFKNLVPTAYVKLLERRKAVSCLEEGYSLWPSVGIETSDLWTTIIDQVIRQIIVNKIPVWSTALRTSVELNEGFLTVAGSETKDHAAALAKAHLPIIQLKKSLLTKVQHIADDLQRKLRMMIPSAVRSFLRSETSVKVTNDTAPLILEFCLLDAIDGSSKQVVYEDLGGIEVFPTLSGTLSSPANLFLPRTPEEQDLFAVARPFETVDLRKISRKTQDLLLHDIAQLDTTKCLRHRSLHDLSMDWSNMYRVPAQCSKDGVRMSRLSECNPMLREIWTWICARRREKAEEFPSSLHNLFLVPERNARIRRLASRFDAPTLFIQKQEPLEGLLSKISAQSPNVAPPIFDNHLLTDHALSTIRSDMGASIVFQFAFQDDLESLVAWLVAAKNMLLTVSRDEKKMLLAHLEQLIRMNSRTPQNHLIDQLSQLPLFSTITSSAPYEHWLTVTNAVDRSHNLFEMPAQLPPLPAIESVSFCLLSDPHEKYILEQLGIVERISNEQLLIEYLLPWMHKAAEDSFATVKEKLVDWIFLNSEAPSESWISNVLNHHPIVPLSVSDTEGRPVYARLQDVIDPNSTFAKMYFEDEGRFPDPQFYKRHKRALIACGISNGLFPHTPLDRARVFAEDKTATPTLIEKVECLFNAPLSEDTLASATSVKEIRTLRWIPGTSVLGNPVLLCPIMCRGASQSQLVDKVYGQTPFHMKRRGKWEELLGWDQDVPVPVLLEQLDLCIESREKLKVDRLLRSLARQDISALSSKPCILGSRGDYYTPDQAFYPGTFNLHRLAPQMDRVDDAFAKTHEKLLAALHIRPEPSITDLRKVQDRLGESDRTVLSTDDLYVAIAVLEIATELASDPERLAILLVPDTRSILRAVPDIVHGDRNVSGRMADFHFVSQRVSESLIIRLGIENSFARATRLEIDFEDKDEDEYVPREDLQTTISDTLSRYTITSTFNEYLANADDAHAKKLSWILDECDYYQSDSAETLLDPALGSYLGPALVVYNDRVFLEKDFEGFKNIGRGGKSNDATTIGMFGRGSMSMYHFTDVPQVISAGFFLCLDPQQRCLPRNKHYKRKAGVKLSLAIMRKLAPGHLSPFEALKLGYHKDLDYYKGTIFRFPLRTYSAKSSLLDNHQHADASLVRSLLESYFDNARAALLFLQDVETINFSIRGKEKPEWSISAHRSEASKDEVFGNIIVTVARGEQEARDEWRVGVTDLETSPPDVVKVGKSSSKISECGIAACLRREGRTTEEHISTTNEGQGVFCKLPTTTVSKLPVSFHASFAITGDRKTIAFRETDAVAKWNRWLLTESVPEFYIQFLQDLAPRIGSSVFRFWPQLTESRPENGISDIVAESFWKKVANGNHLLDKLYPLADTEISAHFSDTPLTDLRRSKSRKPRKLHEVTTLEKARFDFLDYNVSAALQALFNLIGLTVVRPPTGVERGLRSVAPKDKMFVVDEHLLSQVFKVEANCVQLERFFASFEIIEDKMRPLSMLLDIIVPRSNDNALENLNGCRILPRPDLQSPLGLLKLAKDTDKVLNWHIAGSLREEKLFSFGQEHFVHTRIRLPAEATNDPTQAHRYPIQEIMNGPFNIRKFVLEDVGFFLNLPASPTKLTNVSEDRDQWSVRFWLYLNSKLTNQVSCAAILDQTEVWDQAVYRTETHQGWKYFTPRAFDSGPCIVEPNDKDQCILCAFFPNIVCMDRKCLPTHLVSTEESLKSPASFARFLRALSKSKWKGSASAESSSSSVMPMKVRDSLRELLFCFLGKLAQGEQVPEKALIRALPIWPRIRRPETDDLSKSLTAKDAFFCKHVAMFAPNWIRGLKKFVEPALVKTHEASLLKLGIPLYSAPQFWSHVSKYLPKTLIDGLARQEYSALVKYIRPYSDSPARLIAPAPDGNGKLCAPNTLYDHDDAIFRAAFYQEKLTRFLHPDLRELRDYWLSNDLRSRPPTGVMSSEDFLQSALAIDLQWKPHESDSSFGNSAVVLAAYLQFYRPEFVKWPSSTWEKLSKVRIFRVRDDVSDQLRYRQSRMAKLASAQKHCALEEVEQSDRTRVIWSQVKLLKQPPVAAVFDVRPSGGGPKITTVFEHLKYLISICKTISQEETSEFLEDVKACYDHLQRYSDQTTQLSGVGDAKIWFNLNSTQTEIILKQDLLPSVIPAKCICLNAPDDIGSIKVAKNFLIPYEKILQRLGCKSIVQPTYETSELSIRVNKWSEASPMAESMAEIQKFQDKGELTDVTFEAQGQRKSAHKVLLAAASEYCKIQFSSRWEENLKRQAVISLEDIDYSTLSTMIDFAYTGTFVEPQLTNATPNDKVADIRDDLLDLLTATDRWFMHRLHEKVEVFMIAPKNVHLFVRVENVGAVMERAESANAKTLQATCKRFRAHNLEFVESYEKEAAK